MTPADKLGKLNQLVEFHETNARLEPDPEKAQLFRQTILMLRMQKVEVTKELLAHG